VNRIRTAGSIAELKSLIDPSTAPLIVVPVHNALQEALDCLESILLHSPEGVEILVIDDGSIDPLAPELIPSLNQAACIYLWRREENLGFVLTMNQAFEAAGRRDVLLVNSDVVVGPEWFGRLQAAALSDHRVATATPLTNFGTFLSTPYRKPTKRLPTGHSVPSAALAVAGASRRLYPEIPVCVGHVVYFRRFALDLVGVLDEAFSPGYGEEVDFSLRCRAVGLTHVCADDVFVYHSGGASFGPKQGSEAQRLRSSELIGQRYPFYYEWVGEVNTGDRSPLAASITTARIALSGIRLLVDATCLGPDVVVGTQRITIEAVAALARHERVGQLAVLIQNETVRESISRCLPEHTRIDFLLLSDPSSYESYSHDKMDVAFRPFQIHGNIRELSRLQSFARRTVVWQLDFISFDTPFYKPDLRSWRAIRDLTRLTLAAVDGVATLSNYVLAQGHANGLIRSGPSSRAVYPGTDHSIDAGKPRRPEALASNQRFEKYVLCFGTDYRHKNRPFAIEVFWAMKKHGYSGSLLIVGASVAHGSSRAEEASLLSANPSLAAHVLTIGPITDPEREWLLRNADLILYPSLSEGFGLIPFEAAAASIPCLPSRMASLDEVLPEGIETIQSWDAEAVAAAALRLIDEPDARARQIASLQERARDFTWDQCANQIVDLAGEVASSTSPQVVALTTEDGNVLAVGNEGSRFFRLALKTLNKAARVAGSPPPGLGTLASGVRILLRKPYRAIRRRVEGK
jgi:GT2 family glycosyltransferase/glycosyltransferase involved in cell wall biosynthesis